MTDPVSPAPSLIDLPTYLFARREALLHIWRTACDQDPSLRMGINLSREEFNDHVPLMLGLFEQQLRHEPTETSLNQAAAEHGLHRWHKGYTLGELLAELNHLNQCLAAELTAYRNQYPEADPLVITSAYELVMHFSSQLISGSVQQYTELDRSQAVERAGMLQQALNTVTELTRQRGEFLRMTSHDLRGSFGVIQGAASLLNLPDASEQKRADRLQMLRRNLKTVETMLSQLTDLSRLEAGQEMVTLKSVNVGALLRSIVESAQPLAAERGLSLRADGPDQLSVQTDAVLVQRVIQNLLLNALQHTKAGLISVSWSHEDSYRWFVSVQDTGTGLPTEVAASLVQPLKPTLDSASVLENTEPEALLSDRVDVESSTGEGIGLHIVKWLCQLLNATIDIETKAGVGTLFRVRLPMNGGMPASE